MKTPLIDAAYQAKEHNSKHYFQMFGEMKDLMEKSIAAKHIWNVEIEEIKHFVSRVCDDAMRVVKHAYYDTLPKNQSYGLEKEHEIGYMFSPHETAGYIKKIKGWLKRKQVTDNAELQNLLALFGEVAALYVQFNSLKPYIEKGRKPNPNAVAPDLSHTGHCGICQAHDVRVTKLGPGNKLVDHGFQISTGWGHYLGFRNGHCFGVKYEPLELSCQANKDFLVRLNQQLKDFEKTLAGMNAGTARIAIEERKNSISRPELIFIGPDDPRYAKELPRAIRQMEENIRHVKNAITYQEDIIKNWTLQLLAYGGYEK